MYRLPRDIRLENLRRSLIMLNDGQFALRREDALALIEEFAGLEETVQLIRTELTRLVALLIDEDPSAA